MNTAEPTVINLDALPEQAPASAAATVVIDDESGKTVIVNEDDTLDELPERAKRNPDGSITLTLYKPIPTIVRSSHGGDVAKTYEALTFGRINGADIRAIMAASPETQGIVLMARSARISQLVMNKIWDVMDGADIAAAQDVVQLFFGTGQKTLRRT